MPSLRQILLGLVTALASTTLLFGGFSLALAEGGRLPTGERHSPTPTATQEAATTTSWTNTPTAPLIPSPTSSLTPLPPPPTSCPAPAGWIPYLVQPGDTLDGLASRYGTSVSELSQANCVWSIESLAGVILYVPPVTTPTPVPCGPLEGWVRYVVVRGDSLYRLSKTYGTTVAALQHANCLTGTSIRTGQILFVPPGVPTSPPYMTETAGPYDTPIQIWFDIPTETATEEATP